jgi:prevent-host-death family protein
MTNSISLFESKAHLSELVRQVAETGQGIAISVRGTPKVRIVPFDAPVALPNAWEVRERLDVEYGTPDFIDPPRTADVPRNPFADESGS